MSRSRRKTPITGNSNAETTRDYKKQRASNERCHERTLTRAAALGDEQAQEKLEIEQSPWDEWDCERDGKQWIGDLSDIPYRDKLMRK